MSAFGRLLPLRSAQRMIANDPKRTFGLVEYLKRCIGYENMSRDKTIEEEFVRAFVIKERRERTLFELASKKKRDNFFSKLCHNFDKILDERFMAAVQVPVFDEALLLLKSHGAPSHCYVMSFGELDGQKLLLFDALREAVGMGMPSIVICIPGRLAYFEAEQEYGPPPRFLLKQD
jgi:hypothetical protein